MPNDRATRPMRRRTDLLLAIALLALAALATGPGLLPGRTVLPLDVLGLFAPWRDLGSPRNPLLGDPILQLAPRVFAAAAWRAGHLPLWNPDLMAGHPQVGDTLSSSFYPIQVLLDVLFGPVRGRSLQAWLQLWLAGLFMLGWMRALRLSRMASSFAAVGWMLAGYQQVWLTHSYFLGTLLWLPAAAAAWELARVAPGPREARGWTAAGGLAAGLAVLGGQLQFVAYGALVLGVYGLLRLVFDARANARANARADARADARPGTHTAARADARARRGRGLRAGLAMAGIGLLVSAPHWLPVLQVARDAARSRFSPSALLETGLPLGQLVTAVAPYALGGPRGGDYLGAQNLAELAVYVGILPLLCLALLPWAWRDGRARVFAGLALVLAALILAAPPAALLAWLPWLQRFGLMRWLSMWPLVLLPLAALCLEAGGRAQPAWTARMRAEQTGEASPAPASAPSGGTRLANAVAPALAVALAMGLLALWLALAQVRGALVRETLVPTLWIALSGLALLAFLLRPERAWARALPALVLAADLLAFGWGFTPSAPLTAAFPARPPLDALLREQSEAHAPFRVAAFQSSPIVLGPSVAATMGLPGIGGYTSSLRQSYRAFVAALSEPADNDALRANANILAPGDASPLLLRLLDVRYVLSPAPIDPVWREALPRAGCAQTRALRPGARLERAFVPRAGGLNALDVEVASGGTVALRVARDGQDDAEAIYAELGPEQGRRRIAYFAPQPGSADRPYRAWLDLPAGAGEAEVCADGAGRLSLGVWTTEPRFATVAEANEVVVSRVPDPLGRAWVVPEARLAADHAAALDGLIAADFAPEALVLLEAADGPVEEVAGDAREDRSLSLSAVRSWRAEAPGRRVVELAPGAGGWLVLAEAYTPGWRAEVDGAPAAVRRANGGIQALALPDGAREARLWYWPPGFGLALLAAALGALWAAAWLAAGLRAGRETGQKAGQKAEQSGRRAERP